MIFFYIIASRVISLSYLIKKYNYGKIQPLVYMLHTQSEITNKEYSCAICMIVSAVKHAQLDQNSSHLLICSSF